MIAITSPEQFKSAAKTARELKPMVEVVKFGTYLVWGRTGDYTVTFGKDSQGRFAGSCNCRAGKNGRVCFHLASSYMAHKIQIAVRRQVREYQAGQTPSVADWNVETKEAA